MKKTYITAGIVFVLLVVGMMIYVASIPRWSVDQLIIDRATTFITSPLDEDGYPDYVTALNTIDATGVTPENNAAVLILQTLDLSPQHAESKNRFCEELGLTSVVASGRWEFWSEFAERTKGNDLANDSQDDVYDMYTLAFRSPWTADQLPDVAQWLQDQEPALSLVIQASKQSKYYAPLGGIHLSSESTNIAVILITELQQLTDALRMRAMLRTATEDVDGAWNDLQACRRLARLIGPSDWSGNLIGSGIELNAMDAQCILFEYVKPTHNQLQGWKSDLIGLGMPPRILPRNLDRTARFGILADICRTAAGVSEQSGSKESRRLSDAAIDRINWNTPLQSANVWFDRATTAAAIEVPKQRSAAIHQLAQEHYDLQSETLPTSFKWQFETPRQADAFLNQLFLSPVFPHLIMVDKCESRSRTHVDLTHIALALLECKTQQGGYPDDLNQLVPKFLATIPVDHFNGSALVYKRTESGYLLYSFGPNGLDGGGDNSHEPAAADDVAISIPVRKQQTRAERKAAEIAAQSTLPPGELASDMPATDLPTEDATNAGD